jgi:uncharacterized membrane protein YphA (DoxX/SURF4 family)
MNDKPKSLIARMDATGIPLLLARLVIAFEFIRLGIAKVGDPVTFLKLMRQYQVLPEDPAIYMNALAVILPWVEILCGVALLLGIMVRGAGLISAGMLAAFTPLIITRGLELFREGAADTLCAVSFNCGCGGGDVFVCSKVAVNTGLFLLALLATFSRSRRFCLVQLWQREPTLEPVTG